jgi:hypothetical protein
MVVGVSKSCVRNEGEDCLGMVRENDYINDMGEYNMDDDHFID